MSWSIPSGFILRVPGGYLVRAARGRMCLHSKVYPDLEDARQRLLDELGASDVLRLIATDLEPGGVPGIWVAEIRQYVELMGGWYDAPEQNRGRVGRVTSN